PLKSSALNRESRRRGNSPPSLRSKRRNGPRPCARRGSKWSDDLLGFDVRGFDDGRPAGNIVFDLRGEGLRAASGLIWNFAAKFEKTFMRVGVVQRLVEGIS